MSQDFRIEERAPQPALSMRTRTTMAQLPEFFDRAYGAVLGRMAELGETPAGAPFAYYHNLNFDDLDIEAGFPVSRELESNGEVQAITLPGGRYCVGIHQGSYDTLSQTWDALVKYATDQGHTPAGFVIEHYLTNPTEVAPEDNQTLLTLPLVE